MSKISKVFGGLFLVVAIIVFGFNPAEATSQRLKGMGMDSDTYWMIQKDSAFIGFNPAHLKQLPDLIYGTPGSAGIFISPMDALKVKFSTGGSVDFSGFQQDPNNTSLTREQIALTAVYSMGNMDFGLKAGYACASDVDDSTGTETDYGRSLIDTKAGFFMDLGSGKNIDAALGMKFWKISDTAAGTDVYQAGTMDLLAMARFNMATSETNKIHAFAQINMDNRSDTLGAADEVVDKDMKLTLGVSDEMNLNKTSLVYFGLMYDTNGNTYDAGTEVKSRSSNLNLAMGVEAMFIENLTARFGANRTLMSFASNEQAETSSIDDGAATNAAIGMSYKLGNVKLEWNLNYGLFTTGPSVISGGGANLTNTTADFIILYIF